MSLTLEEANRIIRGALAKAQELNIKISAAVCDGGGRLIALQRMDNAIWASAYGSQGKAVASAAFGRPSGEMAERADQPTPRGIAAASGGQKPPTRRPCPGCHRRSPRWRCPCAAMRSAGRRCRKPRR